jgi:hypothetical protein
MLLGSKMTSLVAKSIFIKAILNPYRSDYACNDCSSTLIFSPDGIVNFESPSARPELGQLLDYGFHARAHEFEHATFVCAVEPMVFKLFQ